MDIVQGTRSVAVCYAMMESGVCGDVVSIEDVMSERIDAYQAEINADLSI